MDRYKLTKSDLIRLILSAAICAVAVLSFIYKEDAMRLVRSRIDGGGISVADITFDDAARNIEIPASVQQDTTEQAPIINFGVSVEAPYYVEINMLEPAPTPKPIVIETAYVEDVEIKPITEVKIDIVERERTDKLRVLIYHTHTEEAYTATAVMAYAPHGKYYTRNGDRNVVAVGAKLAEILTLEYGMEVVHDTTNHCPPNFDTAYTRSLQTIQSYTERGETFDLYLDLHRDTPNGRHKTNYVTVNGINAARIMMLIGKGEGYSVKPDWQKNKALADNISDAINLVEPTFSDGVNIANTNRYNQHVSTGAILIEVGNTNNTLEEALAAMPHLAGAIDAAMK
ncbi:MAG: stage II sporulation protein P [Oscillospiraceae bacterium]|jgi:stage II sporulation protein P|nr:stage II sporulation protein P [Oscillospiraceae bacterium]